MTVPNLQITIQKARSPRKGRVLGPAPGSLRHVRERKSPPSEEAFQAAEERQRGPGQRVGRPGQHKSVLLQPVRARAPGDPAGSLSRGAFDVHPAEEVVHHREFDISRRADGEGATSAATPVRAVGVDTLLRPGDGAVCATGGVLRPRLRAQPRRAAQ